MRAKQIPLKTGVRKTVRVATNNNFNCTIKEFKQLAALTLANPDSVFFINSNINTPELLRVNEHPYKIVVTVNPTLLVRNECIDKLYQLNKDLVAFVRVKYIPGHPEIKDLITKLAKDDYAVVVTVQRWNGREALLNWTKLEHYTFAHNRYRLSGEALKELQDFVDSFEQEKVFICDRVGGGCGACKLCTMLTSGEQSKLASINLSSSGLCQFNCPDCYAKTMQAMVLAFGYQPIVYDHIKANSKQAGNTAHIKDTLQKARS
jgi:heme-degrading monooxygenase HmoA